MNAPAALPTISDVKKPVLYSVWQVVDMTWCACMMAATAVFVVLFLWERAGGDWIVPGVAAAMLLMSMLPILLPVKYEITSDGICRKLLGWRKMVKWDAIQCYQVQKNGLLLIPREERFWLDYFRGFFLPVPPSMMAEILHRFRVCVDKQTE